MTAEVVRVRWGRTETVYAAIIAVLLPLLLVVFGALYYAANWHRMADECSVGSNMSYSFSLSHGFTCTAGSGKSESKYWW